jgi:hypothetical protein
MTARASARSRTKPEAGSDGQIPIAAWINAFPPEIARLIREIRAVAKNVAPDGVEQAYRGWSMRIRSDHGLVALRGSRDHARVVLSKGEALRDPSQLLADGAVTIRTVEEARSDALRDLIRQELRTGPTRLSVEKGAGKRIYQRLQRMCLALPDVSERPSHGAPTFFRKSKQFAQVWTDHHGDGRFALWCAAPTGAQPALVTSDPERFFVPPYVGHRGWLGVRLDRPIDQGELQAILEDAYSAVRP